MRSETPSWCVLKKHTETNSHASCVALISEILSPHSFPLWQFSFRELLFVLVFFFLIIELGILTSFIVSSFTEIMGIWACSEGQFGKILVCLICLIIKSKGDIVFLKHGGKRGKEAAEDRSGVPEELSGQGRNHKCRQEGSAFYKQRASYASQVKTVSSRLRKVANKQRIKVYCHEQERALLRSADLPLG